MTIARKGVVALAVLVLATVAAAAAAPPMPADAPKVSPNDLPAPSLPGDPTLASIDAALAQHRIEQARDLLARRRSIADSMELRLREAEVALAGDANAEAINGFSRLCDQAPVAAAANQGLGIALLRQGDTAAAGKALDTALALDPRLERAQLARAVIADRARDWPRADAAYAVVLAQNPRSAAALANRGYSRLLRARYGEAEADLVAALAIDPAMTAATTNLRLARAMQGKYEAAFAGSKRDALAADLNTVGFAAMSRGDYAVAEGYFNRAMSLNTRFDRTAWANLQYLKQLMAKPADTGTAEH